MPMRRPKLAKEYACLNAGGNANPDKTKISAKLKRK